MMTNDELRAMGCTPIEDLIAEDFGKPGTPSRDRFDRDAEKDTRQKTCNFTPNDKLK